MRILSFVLILLLSLTFLSGCTQPPEQDTGEDFVFTALDGTKKNLSDYRGKIVILDLWATWCQPCQIQMLELRKVYENYSRNDLEILSIDIEQSETSQQIQSFINAYKQYNYELTWTFGKDDGSIWSKYKVGQGGIPALCIFDKKGKLYFAHEGLAVLSETPQGYPQGLAQLAPIINELLDKNQ